MPTAKWTRIVILMASTIGAAIVWGITGKVDIVFARAVATTSWIVAPFLLGYESWAWRRVPLKWLTKRPVLNGTWKAELRTTWPDRATETIECYIAIRQTYSRICVDMLFERSISRWLSGNLVSESGRRILYFLFLTQASALYRDANPPARGGAALVVAREPRLSLEGDYWTERETRGSVRAVGWSANVYETYNSARAAEYR